MYLRLKICIYLYYCIIQSPPAKYFSLAKAFRYDAMGVFPVTANKLSGNSQANGASV